MFRVQSHPVGYDDRSDQLLYGNVARLCLIPQQKEVRIPQGEDEFCHELMNA